MGEITHSFYLSRKENCGCQKEPALVGLEALYPHPLDHFCWADSYNFFTRISILPRWTRPRKMRCGIRKTLIIIPFRECVLGRCTDTLFDDWQEKRTHLPPLPLSYPYTLSLSQTLSPFSLYSVAQEGHIALDGWMSVGPTAPSVASLELLGFSQYSQTFRDLMGVNTFHFQPTHNHPLDTCSLTLT